MAFAVLAAAFLARAAPPGRHPAYAFTSLLQPGFEPLVGDMDWMPDGRLALVTLRLKDHNHLSGPSELFLLDGVLKGPADAVTIRRYAGGFYCPLGLKVVDGDVYVLDNREGLIRLIDADRDGVAEARSVIWSQGFRTEDRKWVGGLAYKSGHFFAAIGVWIKEGGLSGHPQPPFRGTVVRIAKDGSTGEPFIGGLRNPNGIGLGPGGTIFLTDNQGEWLPSSKLIEARTGEFHGHRETPFQDSPRVQPVVWLPHGDLSRSPSTPIVLTEGRYAGQMLVGEVTMQSIFRVSLERIDNRLQGCVFPFAWNMPAGVNRLLAGPGGAIVVGGVGGNGGWTTTSRWHDLQRMEPTGEVPFEMLAVRSLGPSVLEVEFTKPIAATSAVPHRFQVRQWRYEPTAAYGGPKLDDSFRLVRGVTLAKDGHRAALDIEGLRAGHVVRIRIPDLKSRDGEEPWAREAYYTLNAFGPAGKLPADWPLPPMDDAVADRRPPTRLWRVPPRGRRPMLTVSADGRVVRVIPRKAP